MAMYRSLIMRPPLTNRVIILRRKRNLHSHRLKPESVYPLIVPSKTAKSRIAKRQREEDYMNEVRSATVDDKLRLLTKIQRMKYIMFPQTFALNADKWYQHFTKTAYLHGLPDQFSVELSENTMFQVSTKAPVNGDDKALLDLRSLVCNSILQENMYLKKTKIFLQKEQQTFASPFLGNLVSGIASALAKYSPLLKVSCLDFNPQVNFYWMKGDRTIPAGHRRGRIEPVRFQIDDKPNCQIRVPQQLPEMLPLETEISAEVPEIRYGPELLPLYRRQYENRIFTGSKLADPCSYGHTQFHLVMDRFLRRNLCKANLDDQIEVRLRANAIASLFAWTGAQAVYQGFWSHEDLTRPFVSQAIITDGQCFSFFCYQLNTLALNDSDNPRKNLCWGTGSMRLYEAIQDGNVIGLDNNVLKLLVKFLLNGAKGDI
ncbi:39S ribosomal protein S30, mitochondrial [Conger conger]|uniref:39S ribosomal protein S30, mitochondrial n=2 Tax=Teleostei TaxID=32443 RepID=UPI002A599941|nr:39S ribosomal protein S30, mitochondrial [Conger conger]